jgi:hypothetical protein
MSDSLESISSTAESWTDDIEDVLVSILHNTHSIQKQHKKNFIRYQNQLKWYKIPIIIIASINSVLSVGLTSFIIQKYVSAITCILSLICASISSIELYLNIGTNVETELDAYRSYQILSNKISSTLKLSYSNRETHGMQFLNTCLNEYNQLFESSLVIVPDLDDMLLNKHIITRHKNPLRIKIPKKIPSEVHSNELSPTLDATL